MNPNEVALARYKQIEPFLLRSATLTQISKESGVPVRTLQFWVSTFKKKGLSGLTPKSRNDKGKRRSANAEIVELIQGLFLRTPPVPTSTIHRMVREVCKKNGWRVPSYDVVHDVILSIPPALKTLAHEGAKAYKQAFGLVHRFEAERPNEIWQADHTPLDILLLDSNKQPFSPWLTAIVDDYSRAVPGYFLGALPPSSIRIALALRQAIWRKDDKNWTICGIPEKLYSDRGSDFMSNHIDQVAINLKFETIQTEPEDPQGKGKCERFFRTVNDMLLSSLPGYAPSNSNAKIQAVLTLEQFEQRFKSWLVNEYHTRKHEETNMPPNERWESFPFVPRHPDSLEQLDLLLLTLAKTRQVRRDGIRFSGYRYFDVSLSGYIGEEVIVRYDPRDLSHVLVYSDNRFICKAACFELTGTPMSLKEVRQARNHEAKLQRERLKELLAVAEKYAPVTHLPEPEVEISKVQSQPIEYPKLKIKRFACDDD